MRFILFIMVFISFMVHAEISAKSGRYYLEVNGERLSKYYMTNHTAMVAAVNETIRCNCGVVIVTPNIYIDYLAMNVVEDKLVTLVQFGWVMPDRREDGSILMPEDIDGYILSIYGSEGVRDIEVKGLSHVEEMVEGRYEIDIRTIANGIEGSRSEKIVVEI